MESNKEQMSLINIKGGVAVELFDFEFQNVLKNIIDPNTNAEAVREITLKVKIKPDKERNFGPISIQAVAKLAPAAPVTTQAFFGMERGKAVAHEYNPKQGDLFEKPTELAAVRKEGEQK